MHGVFRSNAFAAVILLSFLGPPAAIGEDDGAFSHPVDVNAVKRAGRHVERGKSLLTVEDHRGAIMEFTEALRLFSDYPEAWYQRGFAKAYLGDFDGAVDDISQAIKRNPDDYRFHEARGVARRKNRDFEGAVADFTQANILAPGEPEPLVRRGLVRMNLGDYAGAETDYTGALKNAPQMVGIYLYRGEARARAGDTEGAILDYDFALKRKPDFGHAYLLRGETRIFQRDVGRGMKDFSLAVRHSPKSASPLLMRGLLRYAQAEYKDAREDLRKAFIRMDEPHARDYPELWMWLIYVRLGDREGADMALRNYIETRPLAPLNNWYERLADFFLGKIDEETLFTIAREGGGTDSLERFCEALYYAAQMRLINDQRDDAVSYLRLCVKSGLRTFYEYKAAIVQLDAMNEEIPAEAPAASVSQ